MKKDDEVGSGIIHCLECGLTAEVKAEDMAAWEALGCPECGNVANTNIDVGTGRGSVDTAVHNDDGSITCTFCNGIITSVFQENEEGEIVGTILRESPVEIHDCPSCDRAFNRMKREGFI